MKKVLNLTLASLLVLPVAAFAAPPTQVQGPAQAPSKAVQAPVQAPAKAVQAPTQAPAKTAQADTGYRTYSYQPGTAPMNSGYNYGRPNREPAFFSGFQNAGYKVRGEFWAR
jgi:hypothetical protein